MGLFGDMFNKDFGSGSSGSGGGLFPISGGSGVAPNPFTSTGAKKGGFLSALQGFASTSGASGFMPAVGGSFEGEMFSNTVNTAVTSFLSGDFLGGIKSITDTVSTLINPDKYRDKVTQSRVKKMWTKFSNSAKDLTAINALYLDARKSWRFESTKKGNYQERYLTPLEPLTEALRKDGYTSTTKQGLADDKYTFDYPVWEKPTYVEQKYNQVKQTVANNQGSAGLLTLGAVGLTLYSLFKK